MGSYKPRHSMCLVQNHCISLRSQQLFCDQLLGCDVMHAVVAYVRLVLTAEVVLSGLGAAGVPSWPAMAAAGGWQQGLAVAGSITRLDELGL